MSKYIPSVLYDDLTVQKLYSVHYYEYSHNYEFPGEAHMFWEMVYIDSGDAIITSENNEFILTRGEVYFHPPGEWHKIKATSTAPSVVIVGFECKSEAMHFFKDKVLRVGQHQKELISKIISEYTNCFETPLDRVFCYKLKRRTDAVFGSQQLLKNYLSELLILFMRTPISDKQYPQISKNNYDAHLNIIVNYMYSHINKNITVAELENFSSLSKSSINKLFAETFSVSPIRYFHTIKIERAKQLLRENNYNVSQISDMLGYSAIHYFSRRFKQITGMSPIEYSRSIKALIP